MQSTEERSAEAAISKKVRTVGTRRLIIEFLSGVVGCFFWQRSLTQFVGGNPAGASEEEGLPKKAAGGRRGHRDSASSALRRVKVHCTVSSFVQYGEAPIGRLSAAAEGPRPDGGSF